MTATLTVPATRIQPRRSTRRRRDNLAGYAFISPALLLFLLFIAIPLVACIVLSFTSWDVLTPAKWAGLANYRKLAHDSVAWQALVNTVLFAAASVVTHIVIGMALALAVNRMGSRILRYIVRTTIFFPVIVSWAAAALLWRYVLDPDFGFVTYYLKKLGASPPAWFISDTWALPSLISIDLWKTLGLTFIILLAGLQTVPETLHEAAAIDGAGAWRRFWNVTVPMMSPTLLFAAITTAIGALQIFEPMYIITQGGPNNSTLSMSEYVYNTAFRDFTMGYACTLALCLVVAIMLITGIQFWLSRRWVTYDR
jgi:multiple sugar transport system permease protein